MRELDKQHRDEGGVDLGQNRVGIDADKRLDTCGVLERFEEHFDLLALLVNRGNVDGGQA